MVTARCRTAIACSGLAVLAVLAFPAAASAHAMLESSSPARGAQVERAPDRVELRFNEPVEIAFGAVRVYDADGGRMDSGPTEHPGGRGEAVAVKLRGGLGDGSTRPPTASSPPTPTRSPGGSTSRLAPAVPRPPRASTN
jgi:methionine-rich copper-binding protein CopC